MTHSPYHAMLNADLRAGRSPSTLQGDFCESPPLADQSRSRVHRSMNYARHVNVYSVSRHSDIDRPFPNTVFRAAGWWWCVEHFSRRRTLLGEPRRQEALPVEFYLSFCARPPFFLIELISVLVFSYFFQPITVADNLYTGIRTTLLRM